LTGSLEKPQTQISSEPALPESEALAYLIVGRPLSQVSQSEGNMLASAAISYGAGQALGLPINWVSMCLRFKREKRSKIHCLQWDWAV